jgi:hypothetical protein
VCFDRSCSSASWAIDVPRLNRLVRTIVRQEATRPASPGNRLNPSAGLDHLSPSPSPSPSTAGAVYCHP